jgi:hypothetical protein
MIEALQICFDEKISSDNPNPNWFALMYIYNFE